MSKEILMSPQELADLLKLPLQSIYQQRYAGGDLPPAIKIGRHLRYRESDVYCWLQAKFNDAKAAA